jgi:hypothetical protein
MDRQYWIVVKIGADELRPRIPLHSVPYALASADGVPIGSILSYAGPADKIPEGYLLCDGSAQKSAAYPQVFNRIGKLWGDGSNDESASTDFNLPDLRGMFLRGADLGTGMDNAAFERQPSPGGDVDTNGVGSNQGTVVGFSSGGFIEAAPSFATVSRSAPLLDPARVSEYIQSFTPNAAVLYIIRVR